MVIAQPAALHILTPGSPAYALAKLSAVGGLVALRVVLARRERRRHQTETEVDIPDPAPVRRQPHPVSRKNRKHRRRG
jgi:hypothetical protein